MKRVSDILLSLVSMFIITLAFGQSTDPKLKPATLVVPATPNATKMTEYYAQRPNMYTGTANVSVPLYTINFEGWSLPLSISYNATGIRTNEEASEVGLGWALNATGIISRSINGGDDLFQGTTLNGKVGYVYDKRPVKFNPITLKLYFDERKDPLAIPEDSSYYRYLAQKGSDTQPDVFNYNFFGYSGSFVLSKKLTPATIIQILKITDDACSINFNEQDQTFTIITPLGFKGTFSVKERSTTFSSRAPEGTTLNNWLTCCDARYIDIRNSQDLSGQFRTISSWYLSEIRSPHGDLLTFRYAFGEGGRSFHSLSRSMGEFENPGSPRICIQTIHEHAYLSSIESDEVQIIFAMESRDDIRMNTLFTLSQNPGYPFQNPIKLKRYNAIYIRGVDPASSFQRNITFVQNYFNQNYHNKAVDTEDEVLYLRSRLDRVRIDDQEYSFFYRNPGSLPYKLTTAIDHFGFYNGVEQDNRMLLPPIPMTGERFSEPSETGNDALNKPQFYQQHYKRLVDPAFGLNGILMKVKYPTGGYTEFEYEPHRYMPNQSLPFKEATSDTRGNLAGGARIKSIKDFTADGVLALRKGYFYNQNHLDNFSPSTGKMMTPLYNRYERIMRDGSLQVKYVYRSHSGIPGSTAAQGKVIGYSVVNEVIYGENDSYRNRYTFENRPNKVGDFNFTAAGYPNLNGQSIETRNYNSNGQIVQQSVNSDYYEVFGDIKGIVYEQYDPPTYYMGYHAAYIVDRTFISPHTTVTTIASTPSEIVTNKNDSIISYGNSQQVRTIRVFNSKRQMHKMSVANSLSKTITTEYHRPSDYLNKSSILRRMVHPDTNMIEPVIEEKTWHDNKLIAAKATLYGKDVNRFINITSSYVWNPALGNLPQNSNGSSFASPYEIKTNFTKYDARGNLLEYKTTDGVTNSFVWGYNNKLPVIHGVGLPHSALTQAYSASVGANFETAIRAHANTAGKSVTTYDHNPLVGVSGITDPNGIKRSFIYDDFARLKSTSDNKGNVLEQYKLHVRECLPLRILNLSVTLLDFGQQVADFFKPTFLDYEKCGNNKRQFVLRNDGEDDLTVTSMNLPAGYTASWNGGIISAGTFIEITITFNTLGDLSPGNYNGSINFVSNKTAGVTSLIVKGSLIARVCNLVPDQTTVDFGQTTSAFQNKTLIITNNGLGALRIIGTPLKWDGVRTDYGNFTHPDFSVEANPTCISPSQTQSINVSFLPKGTGPTQTTLSLINDSGCPASTVTLKGDRRPVSEAVMIAIASQPQVTPVNTDTTIQLRVWNPGLYQLNVTGVTVSSGDATRFRISPVKFNVDPGQEQIINVSFATTQFDFTQRDITYMFQSNATNVDAGKISRTVSVRRALRMGLRFSMGTTPISGSQPLIYTAGNQQKTVTIENTGNNYETITGLYFSPITPGSQELATSEWWQLVGSPPLNATLAPRETRTINLRLYNTINPPQQLVFTKYMSTAGEQSFSDKRSFALRAELPGSTPSGGIRNDIIDVLDLTNNWTLTFSQNPITNQLKNNSAVPLKIDAVDFDTRSGQINYTFQIGSVEYTIPQLLQARPAIAAQSAFTMKISTSSFQSGASDVVRIKFYRADDPAKVIVKTLIKSVSRQQR